MLDIAQQPSIEHQSHRNNTISSDHITFHSGLLKSSLVIIIEGLFPPFIGLYSSSVASKS